MNDDYMYEGTKKMVALCERNDIKCSLLARMQGYEIIRIQGDFLLPYLKEIICHEKGYGYSLSITMPMFYHPDERILNLALDYISNTFQTSWHNYLDISKEGIRIAEFIEPAENGDIDHINIWQIIKNLEYKIENVVSKIREWGCKI